MQTLFWSFTHVQSVINIVTEFAYNMLIWPAHKLTYACATRYLPGELFICEQDSAVTHRARDTVWFSVTAQFVSPEHVSYLDFQPGQSHRQNAHLLEELWPTHHLQIYWSLAWQTESCCSTEWWIHGTIVLTIWFICCHALLCSVCILRTFIDIAIVYRALRWYYCDNK